MAEVEALGETYLFVEKHCPICVAATSCTGLCGEEINVFRKVLGKKVKIERTEHLLEGSHRCAYRIW
jgi:predicted ArsR family transcriptional regulator